MKSANCISAIGRMPIMRRANCRTDNCGFRNGRIDDARFAEFLQQAGGDLECAAVDADVFAENEDVVVPFHFFGDSLADRFDVGG